MESKDIIWDIFSFIKREMKALCMHKLKTRIILRISKTSVSLNLKTNKYLSLFKTKKVLI